MPSKKDLMDKAKVLKKNCKCNKAISSYNKSQLEQYINNKEISKKTKRKPKALNKKITEYTPKKYVQPPQKRVMGGRNRKPIKKTKRIFEHQGAYKMNKLLQSKRIEKVTGRRLPMSEMERLEDQGHELRKYAQVKRDNKGANNYLSGYRQTHETCLSEEAFLLSNLSLKNFSDWDLKFRADYYKRGKAFVKVMNLPSDKRPIKYKFCEDKKKRAIERLLNKIDKNFTKTFRKKRMK